MKSSDKTQSVAKVKGTISNAILRGLFAQEYQFKLNFTTKEKTVELSGSYADSREVYALPFADKTGIDEIFIFTALCFPYVSFELSIDNKLIYHTAGEGVEYAVDSIFGGGFIKNFLKIHTFDAHGTCFEGYILKPDALITKRICRIFVNRSETADRYIHTSVNRAYEPYIMRENASYILYITTSADATLSERDTPLVADSLYNIVETSLSRFFSTQQSVSLNTTNYFRMGTGTGDTLRVLSSHDYSSFDGMPCVDHVSDLSSFTLTETARIFNKYIIAKETSTGGFFLIDLPAGIKLVFYLELREDVRNRKVNSVALDVPFDFFAGGNVGRMITKNIPNFSRIGFTVASLGSNEFRFTSAPSSLARFNFLGFTRDITDSIYHPLTIEKLIRFTAKRAAEMSLSRDDRISKLLSLLSSDPYLVNHEEEPIIYSLTEDDVRQIIINKRV